MARLRNNLHTIRGIVLTVSSSVGLATHAPEKPFERPSHLVNAAERSACSTRKPSRDRLVRHNSGHPVSAKT
jgi:hypothetical protein